MVKIVDMREALQQVREKAPNTADAMKRYKSGNAGFTDKAHLKAKGLIPRADGTKKVSPKYEDLDKGDERTIKPIIKQLKKSVKAHDKQAKTLEKDIADEKDLEEQVKDLENQIAEAKKELEEIRLNEEQAHVIRFKRIKDKDRMVVVFRNKHDADMYADNIKKMGGQVFSNKLEKVPLGIKLKTEEMNLDETIKAVQNKAKKTGMPYSILKKVYDRGMAAWKGGHRPGATQQQWAFARVNSFVTKSSGTWGGADKDLAAKVRGSKKEELDQDDEKQVKDVVKGLKKGSALHAKQAKELEKQIADEVELEESSWEKNKTTLPPHLKKLFDKDGNFINPKSQAVFDKMVKDAGGFDGFRKKYNIKEEDLPEACWKGFKQVGMKTKNGRQVPNCVPTEELEEDLRANPQDKDVKKKKGTQPKKYYKDLSGGILEAFGKLF